MHSQSQPAFNQTVNIDRDTKHTVIELRPSRRGQADVWAVRVAAKRQVRGAG